MTRLFFDNALLPDGWAQDVLIDVGCHGRLDQVLAGSTPDGADHHGRVAVPGMPNLHSHAFQRAMAGLAESRGPGEDSFWTWRQAMYRFVAHLTPEDLTAIASQLYVEMLEAGFTSVAEFHYLHHDPGGQPYDDIGEMAAALAEAATTTGIGMTFLPVFYANCGFGGQPPEDGQRRFINTPERYADLHQRICGIARTLPDAAVGIAPHSLRAVTPESLNDILKIGADGPVHIHIAEQIKEVEECKQWSGQRPVQWLLDHVQVDPRWCLVHATHLSAAERQGIAASGAVAGLCPITEANLGDGIFDGVNYINDSGRFGIGSDSNILISVAEELRVLEYSQRLRDQGRNLLVTEGSTGRSLYERSLAGGTQAVGRKVGKLEVGYRADIVTLDTDHPALICRAGDAWLDGWIFATDNQVVSNVWVGGRHMVQAGRHIGRDQARAGFRKTIGRILDT